MAIVKRLGPEGRLLARMGDTWQRLLCAPLVRGMCNPHYRWHVPADPASLAELVGKFYGKNWMTKVTADEKIFLYAAGMVARRADVPGILPDHHMVQLARYMNAASTIDKIDKNEVPVTLNMRMALIWGIPEFLEKYTKPGSYKLPPYTPHPVPKGDAYMLMSYEQRRALDAANPPKPARKKLAKHRK
jgi:hypothetical protein